MASSSHRGGDFYGAASYRSRDGLSTRQVGGSDEIQLQIDPMHGDLDDEITGLRKQVKQLRNVAQEIESEAKYQNDFINLLQMTLIKAQGGVKNNMRRLNRSIIREGSNHVMHVVLFALFIGWPNFHGDKGNPIFLCLPAWFAVSWHSSDEDAIHSNHQTRNF